MRRCHKESESAQKPGSRAVKTVRANDFLRRIRQQEIEYLMLIEREVGAYPAGSCSESGNTHSPLKTNCRLIIVNRASEPIACGNLTGSHNRETALQQTQKQTQKQTHALSRRFDSSSIGWGRCLRE